MDNIYHDYWEQELMYQFITEDKCRKKAYVCSPYSAENNEGMLQNMRTARAYMFYALKKMGMCARAPHAFLPMLLCDSVPSERAIALKFGIELLERSDVLLVCSNRISNGMKSEIAMLRCSECLSSYLTICFIWKCRNSLPRRTAIRKP